MIFREGRQKSESKSEEKSTECWGYRRATTANTLKKNKKPPSQCREKVSPRPRNDENIFISHS
jgi:hypothetical protein